MNELTADNSVENSLQQTEDELFVQNWRASRAKQKRTTELQAQIDGELQKITSEAAGNVDPKGAVLMNPKGTIDENPSLAKQPIDGYTTQGLIGGPVAAVNAGLRAVDDTVAALEKIGLPNAYVQILNEKGEFDLDLLSKEEAAKLREEVGEEGLLQLPNIKPSDEPGKQAVREITQFLTGFALTRKGTGGDAGLEGMKKVGKDIADGIATGAIFMDENRPRIFDMLEGLGLDMPDELLLDEDEGKLEGRIKNGLEEGGFGVLVDPVIEVVRGTRAFLKNRKGIQALEEVDEVAAQVELEDMFSLGDLSEEAPLVGKAEDFVPEGNITEADIAPETLLDRGLINLDETMKDPVYINFARMEDENSVKQVIDTMAQVYSKDIKKAQRGKISQEATQELADNLGMSVTDLLSRRGGEAFNAEQAVASRRILSASGDKLLDLAERASGPNASPKDVFLFRRMASLHRAIQAEVIGARTEVARALASYRIPVGGAEKAKAIETLMGNGGDKVGKELALRLTDLKKKGVSEAGINTALRHGALATTVDAVKESYILGLLWTPSTHVVNMIGNTISLTDGVVNRAVAARINNAVGKDAITEGGVVSGEAKAQIYALKSGWIDALRHAYKATTGEAENIGQINRVEMESRDIKEAISAEAFGISNTNLGRAVNLVGAGVRAPGIALTFNDELFKSFGWRMEVHAQAWRRATQEGLQEGSEEFNTRVADLVNNPPENIRLAAVDAALYNTFQSDVGPLGKVILDTRSAGGVIGYAFLPFGKTPVNLVSFSVERTPLAPLVKRWRDDFAAGGARKDMAIAKMTTGTLTAGVFYDLAKAGVITGGGPENSNLSRRLREQDIPRYAFIAPWDRSTTFEYGRFDPTIAMTASVMADIVDLTERYDFSEESELYELTMATSLAIGRAMNNKSYLKAVSNFTDVASGNKNAIESFGTSTASALVPMSTLWASIERIQDPELREAMSVLEYVQSRLPYLSKDLIPKRNIYGEVIEPGLGKYDIISPIKTNTVKDVPLSREMLELRVGLEPIPYKNVQFMGTQIESMHEFPRVLDEYRRLAGNELVSPIYGAGFKDAGNKMVTGKHDMLSPMYEMLSDGHEGGKATFIRSLRSHYIALAQQEIMTNPEYRDDPEFKAFREMIWDMQDAKVNPMKGIPTIPAIRQ